MSAPVYLDGSAAVKLVRRERWSDQLLEHLAASSTRFSSELLELELRCAVRGLEAPSDTTAELLTAVDELLAALDLLPLTAGVRERGAGAFSPPQPALAAIHLASALSISDGSLEFVTYDDRQLFAARAAGLRVCTPV